MGIRIITQYIIKDTYEVEGIKTIYFQSEEGNWMKRVIKEL